MAKKPSVTTVASGYYGRQALNDNFEALRDAFDNTLSRDGSTPNAMGADLDMNSNDILNAQTVNTEALRINGVLVSSSGLSATGASLYSDNYTGDGTTLAYTMSYQPFIKDNTQVYIDGVYQNKDTYSISGTTLTFSEAPPLNSDIEIVVARSLSVAATDAANVGYNQGGTGAVNTTVESKLQEFVSVKDFGAVGDGVTDDATAVQAAIDYAATSINGSTGMYVYFPTGKYAIGSQINLPNRVGLKGANGRGTTIIPHSSFSDDYLFYASNGTSSMFGSYLQDFYIDTSGFDMLAVIRSVAWQETCGLDRVAIRIVGTTPTAVLIETGYGGAASLKFTDIEFFINSTATTSYGIRVNQISAIGGFVMIVDTATITGNASNQLTHAIYMANDSAHIEKLHSEYVNSMITMAGVGGLYATSCTGSSNSVVNMVTATAAFTGEMTIANMIPNGATGNILQDNVKANHIAASEGKIALHEYNLPAFSAYVGSDISNVTGNGTAYDIVFDTESYDYRNNFNTTNGYFTAPKTGKYLFSFVVKISVDTPATTSQLLLSTSSETIIIFQGDTDSIRSGSGTVTFQGSAMVDLSSAETARLNLTVSGLGSDTVDVLSSSNQTKFSGYYIGR